MATIELPIEGMTCEHCVRSVTDALTHVPGVKSATVSLSDRKAVIESSDGTPTRGQLAAAVAKAGYHVPAATLAPAVAGDGEGRSSASAAGEKELVLNIDGMTCASCIARVETALAAVPGVRSARANLATNQAAVEFEPSRRANVAALVEAVKRAGYSASLAAASEKAGADRSARELSKWRKSLDWAIGLLIPIIILHFLQATGPAAAWIQFVCATALQFFVGWPFLIGALRRARYFTTNMDTLVMIGTLAAYGSGVYSLFMAHEHGEQQMYLMDAGIILTFITLGKFLESQAKGRASAAIRKLLDLAPSLANVERQGQIVTIPPSQVAIGETMVVRPGEKVPLDAEVLTGQSSLDESWLTGESIPADKGPGQRILAGTINGQGALTARVVHTVGETALAQVVLLVRHAQESKTEIQRLADRVVAWFVPVVLVVAGFTLLAWGLFANDWWTGLSATVAVLVVACPCALGLATPTAILVASGRGAELGILIKEAHALELAGRVTTVVLDKTGTVTLGKPQLTRFLLVSGVSEEELLATAASVEQLSQHPLAKPIVAAARERGLALKSVDNLEIVPGQGIRATNNGDVLLVGNERLLAAQGVDWSSHQTQIEALRAEGQAPLLVAWGTRYLGLVAVADVVAPHSREGVDRLKALGVKVLLLSGDHRAIAERVAREVGITEVNAEVLPGEKQEVIARLRSSGEVVAMVGDGINDAPALAAADLGIAIGSGSDIAIEAADIVISGNDLRAVARSIKLARATLRTIQQNLAWAFVYNVLLIPIAAGVLVPWSGFRLPAIAAAAAMAASSVSVVANSLLLRWRKLN